MCFSVKSGLITGRNHLVYGLNCQDSILTKEFVLKEKTYYIGAISDGCGEGKRSEVGAHLAVSYLVNKTYELILSNTEEEDIPPLLFRGLVETLGNLKNSVLSHNSSAEEDVNFIKEHLLFTALGYLITPSLCLIYALGDGVVLLNDFIDIRDENNHPNYIAYNLIDERYLKKSRRPLPKLFDVYRIPTTSLERLAIGTDAWEDELGVLVSLWDEKICKNVQRTMNVLSSKEKRFKDDGAIIIVKREK